MTITGWLTEDEARALASAARRAAHAHPMAHAVELGSYEGKSTVVIAKALPLSTPFTTIDTHQFGTRAKLEHNLSEAGVRATTILQSESTVVEWSDPIAFLFIDADHTYEAVRGDLIHWLPHVLEGGTVCAHDYGHPNFPGVAQALDEATPPLTLDSVTPGTAEYGNLAVFHKGGE